MAGPPESAVLAVSVPARGEFVHVLRAVTASVAARLRIPYDGIEDLRLAVDEACAWLLSRDVALSTMSLGLRPMEDRLEAVVSVDATARAWPPSEPERAFSWQILSALVDAIELDAVAGAPTIRMTKRTLEPSNAP